MTTKNYVSDELFSERLQRCMAELQLAPAQLARSMGITQSTISGWLAGAKPRKLAMEALAAALGTTTQYLETGQGLRTSDAKPRPTMTLEEGMAGQGPAHGMKMLNARLEDLMGKPVQLKRELETLRRMADVVISQDPALAADEKWWQDFDAKHGATGDTHPIQSTTSTQ